MHFDPVSFRNEYYPADLQVAPSQDIGKVKANESTHHESVAEVEEDNSSQNAAEQPEEVVGGNKKKPRRATHK